MLLANGILEGEVVFDCSKISGCGEITLQSFLLAGISEQNDIILAQSLI